MAFAIMFAVNMLITIYLAKQNKQKRTSITALLIDPGQQPLADEVSNYQLTFGICALKGSNCTWYGDYSTFKIYQKVKSGSGLFGTSYEKVQSANGYRLGFVLSLGYGELQLYGLKCNDKYIYNHTGVGSFEDTIDLKDFFGTYEQEGGLSGKFRFYAGTSNQPVDTYVQGKIGQPIPNYFNKSYLCFENFYIGNQNSIQPITAVIGGYPKVSFLDDSKININRSCNPMNIIGHLLTKDFLGIDLPDTQINTASFAACQTTLYNEGFGLSFTKTDDAVTKEIIADINRTIDGQMRFAREDGRLEYKLNRQDYVLDDLFELNIDNIISVTSYATNAAGEMVVEYKVSFTNIDNDFKAQIVTFQNDGKYSETRKPTSKSADYPSVTSEEIARMIALRDALPLTQQFRKIEVKVASIPSNLNFGDVVAFKSDRYRIKKMAMRIASIDFGDSSDTSITLQLNQDIFSKVKMSNNRTNSMWQDIDFTAKNVNLELINSPYFFTSDASISANKYEVMTTAKNLSNVMTDYYIYDNNDIQVGDASGFTPETTLYSAIGRYETTIVLVNDFTLANISSQTETNVKRGANLALITEGSKFEWVSFNSYSSAIISNVKRGLLDSIPQNFTTAARIRFISYGFAFTEALNYNVTNTARLRAQTITAKDTLKLSDATEKTITVTTRSAMPLLGSNFKINNVAFDDTMNISTTALVTASLSFKTKQKEIVQYYNEIQESNVDNISHKISFYNNATGSLIKTDTFTGKSYEFTDEATFNGGSLFASLRVEVVAVKDILESIEKYSVIINRV